MMASLAKRRREQLLLRSLRPTLVPRPALQPAALTDYFRDDFAERSRRLREDLNFRPADPGSPDAITSLADLQAVREMFREFRRGLPFEHRHPELTATDVWPVYCGRCGRFFAGLQARGLYTLHACEPGSTGQPV